VTRDPWLARMRAGGDLAWWSAGMRRITWSLLGHQGGRLLDVGCGPEWSRTVQPPGVWGVGLDRAGHLIGRPSSIVQPGGAQATRIPMDPFVQADASVIPFRTGSFDLVLALDLLEEQGVNPAAVLREIRRVLRPGGRLLARVPAHPWLYGPHDREWGGARRYRRAEFEALIREAGFGIHRLTYANVFVFPFAVLVRLGGRAGLLRDDLLWLARPFGGLMLGALSAEARRLRKHDLPAGLSLVCLAEAESSSAGSSPDGDGSLRNGIVCYND
jgi:SAM-dependent methyltransferase